MAIHMFSTSHEACTTIQLRRAERKCLAAYVCPGRRTQEVAFSDPESKFSSKIVA